MEEKETSQDWGAPNRPSPVIAASPSPFINVSRPILSAAPDNETLSKHSTYVFRHLAVRPPQNKSWKNKTTFMF